MMLVRRVEFASAKAGSGTRLRAFAYPAFVTIEKAKC